MLSPFRDRPLGVTSQLVDCDDRDALLRELERSARKKEALILNPGSLAADSEVESRVVEMMRTVVWVDLSDAKSPQPSAGSSGAMRVRGRGIDSYRWALRRLAQHGASPPLVIAYGQSPEQVGDLRLPSAVGPHPVAVLIHGGSWQEAWERDTIEPLAIDLTARGYATWNIEYRRVGPSGGGWPSTCIDVASAMGKLMSLASEHPLDIERVLVVGHSAEATLRFGRSPNVVSRQINERMLCPVWWFH